MKAYRYNSENKKYEGEATCQIDPLESEIAGKEIYLLAADCTYEVPPEEKDGFDIVWNGDAWEYKEQEKPKEEEPYVPTEDELKTQVRAVRNSYLEQTDKFMLVDYPITDEERELYKQYRTYLRTYPECQDWYKANPKTYDEWYASYLEADKLQTELTVAHQPTEV